MIIMIRKPVTLEPDLEAEAGSMRPAQRRKLARKLYRWAKQLYKSADIIEAREAPKPKPTLKPLCHSKLIKN